MGIPIDSLIAIVGFILAFIGTTVVWVRNRKFPRMSCLLIITILSIVLVFGFFSSFPLYARENIVSDTNISGLTTDITWPIHVVKDQSFVLEVYVIPTPALPPNGTASPSQQKVLSQLTPVGTPNVPISQAFGTKFDAFAIADVNASAFDISPQQQTMQSLDQNEVDFFWTLTPKYTDEQTLRVDVTGIWKPKGGGESIERPLSGQTLSINVMPMMLVNISTSFFVPGQVTLSDLLVALFSSALNVPWIVELVKKRKESKKEQQPATTPSTTAPTPPSAPQQPTIPSPNPTVTKPPTAKQKKKKQTHP
jgi:hypothetical protein